MAPRLRFCPACDAPTKIADTTCPHCGAVHLHLARTVSGPGLVAAVLLGLASSACTSGDDEDTVGSTESASSSATTEAGSGASTLGGTLGNTATSNASGDPAEDTAAPQPPYGVPDTADGPGDDDTTGTTGTTGSTEDEGSDDGVKLDLPR